MKKLAIVILAAGEGTRMKSDLPKVLHRLSGTTLIKWVMASTAGIRPEKTVMIVGHESKRVRAELAKDSIIFAEQNKQLGSGHALHRAEKALVRFKGDVLVVCGDAPLIKSSTLKELVNIHRARGNSVTVLSSMAKEPFGYGRIVRSNAGGFRAIVEEKDAAPAEKKIKEINSGVYCFSSPLVWKILGKISPDNVKKEYYLTDAVKILFDMGEKVEAVAKAVFEETIGINNRSELAYAESVVRKRILIEWMIKGVTIVDPDNTYVSLKARIGTDTVIYPGTFIEGESVIGRNCSIGPAAFISDSRIGDGVEIRSSYIYDSLISDKAKIGPFAHLRPGTKVKTGARVGNFCEIKNSVIGFGAKVSHLSYIGDSFLGEEVNIGAGTITCNYDGTRKNKTYIGDRSFVGSNVNLVAPVRVGADVIIGAGSTITDNIPGKSLAIARARQINKIRRKK
ncbi:MAG: bifunctional UDP-N-acetylglucosamine diphosphorylase/glucosamine-1-phosphate N-acetyltransferase GlmU [Elusimicrobiota bacterium]